MRMMSIASGSSGNCIYVGDDNTHLLIDAGISKKRIEEGLNTIGLTLSDMSGILVTHEHSDHIGGLGVVLRKHNIPVYGTNGTIEEAAKTKYLDKVDMSLLNGVYADEEVCFCLVGYVGSLVQFYKRVGLSGVNHFYIGTVLFNQSS